MYNYEFNSKTFTSVGEISQTICYLTKKINDNNNNNNKKMEFR